MLEEELGQITERNHQLFEEVSDRKQEIIELKKENDSIKLRNE